jgi:hypothetical protein
MNPNEATTQLVTEVVVPPKHMEGGDFSVSAAAGLLNIVAGLMLVASFLLFFGGGVAYLSRLGLVGRDEGLHYMMWGVRVLFVLVIVLGVVQYIQKNPNVVIWIVALVVLFFGGYAIFKTIQESSADSEEH